MNPEERRAFWRGFRQGYLRAYLYALPVCIGFILWWNFR